MYGGITKELLMRLGLFTIVIEETAEVMKLSVDKVKRDWSMVKTWLYHELRIGE